MPVKSTLAIAALAMCGLCHAGSPPPTANVDLGKSVDDSRLAAASGGADIISRQQLSGTVGDNSVDRAITGSNSISGSAFESTAGVPMVIQNSGNNVLIQNATIVNVQFQP